MVQSQAIVLKPKKEMRGINMQYHIMIKNLSKSYQSKGTAKTALSDVTLNIPQGEIFCIMGSSGSGKSTLLKILGGMEKPTSGTVYINGVKCYNKVVTGVANKIY